MDGLSITLVGPQTADPAVGPPLPVPPRLGTALFPLQKGWEPGRKVDFSCAGGE